VIKDDVFKSLKEECFKDSSKRNFFSSMTTSGAVFERLWRPHNFRRQVKIFPFEKVVKTTTLKEKGFVVDTTIPYKMSLHTGIVDIRFSDNISIQVKRETVTGVWEQNVVGGEKETVLLCGNSKREILAKVSFHEKKVFSLLDSAISFVAERFGLHIVGGFVTERKEEWSRSKHFIDNLPKDCIVHEEDWKKVYDVGVEVITKKVDAEDVFKFQKLISNEILLDFAPLISNELMVNRFLAFDIEKWCESNIVSIQDVFKYEGLIAYLPKDKRLEVSNFLFKKFGGVMNV